MESAVLVAGATEGAAAAGGAGAACDRRDIAVTTIAANATPATVQKSANQIGGRSNQFSVDSLGQTGNEQLPYATTGAHPV